MTGSASPGQDGAQRYFDRVDRSLPVVVEADPVCLYLETTNRCNILCTTCPRTYEELEPPADMSWELFRSIVDQFPKIERVVLHGVGEPLMTRDLMPMIRYLKARGTYVLFNTNATLLTEKKGKELIEAGLDEMRVSLDAAEPIAYEQVRGLPLFNRVVENVRAFTQLQREVGAARPQVSLWLTGLKETIGQLPAFVRLAHGLGVKEVYLQRLVYFNEGQGLARAESALFDATGSEESRLVSAAERLAESLGIRFNASGATEPSTSLRKREKNSPWSLCRRPWTLMYFTAHGRALPCCIAPFSMKGYENFTLGDATQQTLREIWTGENYQKFRRALLTDQPPKSCENCGLRWSL
jgi:MoaA/NifB/PqqE/SkfB family radical SAM enzyme